jgi:hypothetical protein
MPRQYGQLSRFAIVTSLHLLPNGPGISGQLVRFHAFLAAQIQRLPQDQNDAQ